MILLIERADLRLFDFNLPLLVLLIFCDYLSKIFLPLAVLLMHHDRLYLLFLEVSVILSFLTIMTLHVTFRDVFFEVFFNKNHKVT